MRKTPRCSSVNYKFLQTFTTSKVNSFLSTIAKTTKTERDGTFYVTIWRERTRGIHHSTDRIVTQCGLNYFESWTRDNMCSIISLGQKLGSCGSILLSAPIEELCDVGFETHFLGFFLIIYRPHATYVVPLFIPIKIISRNLQHWSTNNIQKFYLTFFKIFHLIEINKILIE